MNFNNTLSSQESTTPELQQITEYLSFLNKRSQSLTKEMEELQREIFKYIQKQKDLLNKISSSNALLKISPLLNSSQSYPSVLKTTEISRLEQAIEKLKPTPSWPMDLGEPHSSVAGWI